MKENYIIRNNITQDKIQTLLSNEIFVFGSNLSGIHGAGAAKQALVFGAVWGKGVGLYGQTYAIPTKSEGIKRTLSIDEIKPFVDTFIEFGVSHNNFVFLVTEIGCGLAGHKIEDIAPLFLDAIGVANITLPKRFVKYLNC